MYEAPSITELGTVAEVTMGGSFSGLTDNVYPEGTPSTVPIFS